MRPTIRTLVIAALLLVPASSLRAQTAVNPSGHWEGSIEAPGMNVGIEIDLVKNGNGQLAGTFGQPAQHLKGLPLTSFSVEGRSVSFQIKGGAPGQRVFIGELSADGKSMSGSFASQFGPVSFGLIRTDDARIEAAPKSASIGKELEGIWNGALDVDGGVQLVLTLANQPGGTATGSILNVNEGLEIPIAGITQKATSVTLEVKAVVSSYSGTLSADGTELVGTFVQGPTTLPLTFRRAKR
jgi:hypothetical protein